MPFPLGEIEQIDGKIYSVTKREILPGELERRLEQKEKQKKQLDISIADLASKIKEVKI